MSRSIVAMCACILCLEADGSDFGLHTFTSQTPTINVAQQAKRLRGTSGSRKSSNKSSRDKNFSVTVQFKKARKLFDDEQLIESTYIFRNILERYPEHAPTIELYGKALYRLGKAKEAYGLFRKLNLSRLDVITSYEYGQVFYQNQDFAGALSAFRRIPNDHPLYDLANYYGAICAVRLRQYGDAEVMLKRAIVLPAKLAKSKLQYRRHLAELQLMHEQKSMQQEIEKERETIRRQRLAETMSKDAQSVQKEVKENEGRYQHRGFQSVLQEAKLGSVRRRQDHDYHGYAKSESTSSDLYFSFLGGRVIPLSGNDQTVRRSAIGIELGTRLTQRTQNGTEKRNVILESDPDLVIYLSQVSQSLGKNAQVTGKAWIEFPVFSSTWLGLGGHVFYLFPDFERPNRTASRSAYGALGWKNDVYRFNSTLSYQESVDTKDDLEVTLLHYDVTAGMDLQPTLSLSLSGIFEQFTYQNNQLDGPDSSIRLEATLNQALPLSLSAGARGVFELQAGNLVHDLPTYGNVLADGQLLTGEIFVHAIPFSWLELGMAQMWTSARWAVSPDVAQDVYERNTVGILSDFRVYGSLNLLF